jgi:hypothetical protein
MKVGTKSVLFGAHCFVIHPFFVMVAWIKLYGFPFHPAIWLSFFFHDLGYFGKPNMDGAEGETHVELGAKVLHFLFDRSFVNSFGTRYRRKIWYNFSLYHSRFYAKKDNMPFSKLCVADKLAICLEPAWLYLPRVNWSGEIYEYMAQAKNGDGKYKTMSITTESQKEWFKDVCNYLKKWVNEHRDGRDDTWTPSIKKATTASGVWQ